MSKEVWLVHLDIVTPLEILKNNGIQIKGERIHKIAPVNDSAISHFKNQSIPVHDYKGKYWCFPGLINAHDHLLGSYMPKVGNGPYLTWKEWDDDLKTADVYQERGKISNLDLYYIGAYRHLICGVTTVSDHIPHIVNDNFVDQMPIRVLKDYTLAHEVSSYDLKWGDGVPIEYAKAVKEDIPFITHLEEGFDEEAPRGTDYLLKDNALGEHTVLIHCLALSDKDIKSIAQAGAHIVTCPISNFFMFDLTGRVKQWIEAGINVSIGTDSPMSGGLNLLEEIRFFKQLYQEINQEDFSNKEITKMITLNPAKALRIDKDLGTIEEGKIADLLIIPRKTNNPYDDLFQLRPKHIAALYYKGKLILTDYDFRHHFNGNGYKYIKIERKRKWINTEPDLLELLKRMRKSVGFNKKLPFLPVD